MAPISKITAAISGVIHVLFFVMESVLWLRPSVYEAFEVQSLADAEVLDVYVKNQGYYNLFLAMGVFAGVALAGKWPTVGKTLVFYTSAFMIAAAIVLFFTIPEMIIGVFVQGLMPAITIATLLLFGRNVAAADET